MRPPTHCVPHVRCVPGRIPCSAKCCMHVRYHRLDVFGLPCSFGAATVPRRKLCNSPLRLIPSLLPSPPDSPTFPQGADVNQASASNLRLTALHLACLAGNEGVASLLLRVGASPGVADDLGRLPASLVQPANTDLRELVAAAATAAGVSPDLQGSGLTTPPKRTGRTGVSACWCSLLVLVLLLLLLLFLQLSSLCSCGGCV
jgi:hypothetical protein